MAILEPNSESRTEQGGVPKAEVLQRVSVLAGIPALLAHFGASPEAVLDSLPLEADVFDDPERLIPYSVAGRILENCVRVTGCAHFGLLLGSRFDHRSLGVPGARMQQARTLYEALTIFVALQHSNTRGGAAYLHRWGDFVVFGYGIYDRETAGRTQIYGLTVALGFNIIRGLTGGAAAISDVMFSIRQPLDVAPYKAIFGVPLHFGRPQSGIVLSRASMDTPIKRRAGEDRGHAQELNSSVVPPSGSESTQIVKHKLRPMLLAGNATSTELAA
jgi:hypothetical protein